MALPLTKSAMERLGKRLAKQIPPDQVDLDSLEALLLAFDTPLSEAADRLRTLGLEPTDRIKTTGTILDKLRRHGGSILKSMQDLAGLRVVIAGDWNEQTSVGNQIVELFTLEGQPLPRLTDRRTDPSSGYRAVHVVVHVDGAPVEIQIRTLLQHEWANLYEKLADYVGRTIRYGEPLEELAGEQLARRLLPPGKRSVSPDDLENLRSTYYDSVNATIELAQTLAEVISLYEAELIKEASEEPLDQHRQEIDRIFTRLHSLAELVAPKF